MTLITILLCTLFTCSISYLFASHADYLNSPEVNIISELFGTNDIEVVLDVQTDNLFLLNTSISSSPETNIAINMSSVHFTIPYNTPTNVSVIAHLCGIHNSTVIGLNYGECDNHSSYLTTSNT